MEVLLIKNIPKLGRVGDMVKVKDGYGRNFLIPKGLALTVNPNNLQKAKKLKKQFLKEEAARKDELFKLAEELGKDKIVFRMKANEEGHLYGSVSQAMIADKLKEKGYKVKIDAKDIILVEHIKQIGVVQVEIRLHPEISSKIPVVIEEEVEEEAK